MRPLLLMIFCLLGCSGADPEIDAGTPHDAGHDTGVDAGPRCSARSELSMPLVCNGHADLCERSYDDVSYATTHNAMSSEEEGWIPANQGPALWTQLEDGVRGFLLATFEENGQTLLCHSICSLGSRPFVEALQELHTFMRCHPEEVITLILEAHIDEATTAAAFEAAGLLPLLHEQTLGAPWPTLREMIESGRRLVVFTESSDVTLPWYHYAYAYAWDTPFSNQMPTDLRCAPGRGNASSSLFILNHFLTAPVAMRTLAEMINHDPFMSEYVQRCETESGQRPNFITVDFYDVGDVLSVVNMLNGV